MVLCDVAHHGAEGVPGREAFGERRFRSRQVVVGDLDESNTHLPNQQWPMRSIR